MASKHSQTNIDRFGRIVLPKEIRTRMHLIAGSELEIQEQDNAILLKPITPQARLAEKDGWLVVQTGEPLSKDSIIETLNKIRQERSKL